MIEIREAAGAADLDASLDLRHEVFVAEQGVALEEEIDGRDAEATHFLALQDDRVIGTCRVLTDGDRVRLGRLVVARAARRRGVATALLTRAEAWARERGASAIVLAAQTDAQPLYERAGYVATGALFIDAGIEHVMMHRPLV